MPEKQLLWCLKKQRETGYAKVIYLWFVETSHKLQGKVESWDHSQDRLGKIHAMESRKTMSIFAEDGPHLQTWHGKGKETVTMENNSTSTWHQGMLYFHPSLGEKLIQLLCFPFQNLPETSEQVQEKTKPKLKWFGDSRKCCSVRPPVNSNSLFQFIRKVERVCNSLFFFRRNVLPIQGRKLEQGNSKLEIRHILTVRLINCCNEP